MEAGNVVCSSDQYSVANAGRSVHVYITLSLLCVTMVTLAAIFILPTKFRYSPSDTSYVERSLHADIGIDLANSELIAGAFRREPVLVYQLNEDKIHEERFVRVLSEQQKKDFVNRIAKILQARNIRLTLSDDYETFQFLGSDYSVLYVRSRPVSYLVYFGAQ